MPSFRGRISIQHGLIQPKAYNDHRKVIDGFQVQIDRLEAKEGVLFAAVTSATDTSLSLNNIAQVAAIKEQKAKLETGKTVMFCLDMALLLDNLLTYSGKRNASSPLIC